jgi:apolipoprotein N-acyltransferase
MDRFNLRQKTIRIRSDGRPVRRIKNLALSVASALLLTLSQSPIDLGFVAVAALIPWLLATRRADAIEAVVLGVLMGVVYGLAGANWLISAFESQGAFGFQSVFGALLTAFWGKGLLFGAMGYAVWRLRNEGPLFQGLALAMLFGLGEFWIGASRWGLPFILLGHSQISVPGVAQLAVVAGVPGISALLFATNCALASLFENRRSAAPLAAGLVAAWTASALCGIPLVVALRPSADVETKTLLLVQPTISRDRRWEPAFQNVILDEIAIYTAEALEDAEKSPDAILWPENLLTTPLTKNKKLERQFQAYVDGWNVPVITGLVRISETENSGDYRNSVVWWSPGIGLHDAIDKVRAMPLVESNRDFFGRAALAWFVGEAAGGPRVAESLVLRPLEGAFTVSPVLCFEVLFPGIVAARRNEASVAIVNLADDSWVMGETVDAQLVTVAAFRAIEQRLTLVRVSHGGLSVVIDPLGREIASLPPNVYAHEFAQVSASPPASALERLSLFALPVVAGLVTGLSGVRLVRHRYLHI